jgi:hypothetical protein
LLTVDGNISIAWLFWPDFADYQPAFSGLGVIIYIYFKSFFSKVNWSKYRKLRNNLLSNAENLPP